MAYRHQQNMQHPQHSQQMAYKATSGAQEMQPYQSHSQPQYQQPQPSGPPSPMRIVDDIIYNAHTNQPLYSYTLSKASKSQLSTSLLTMRHVPTGATVGVIRRGEAVGAANCWGMLYCGKPGTEDIVTIGPQGATSVVKELGSSVKSCWAWDPTWTGGGRAAEWAFFEDTGFGSGMVLRDAVADGREVWRVHENGNIKFGDAGMELREEMVGEVMLIMLSLRVNSEDQQTSWWMELLSW